MCECVCVCGIVGCCGDDFGYFRSSGICTSARCKACGLFVLAYEHIFHSHIQYTYIKPMDPHTRTQDNHIHFKSHASTQLIVTQHMKRYILIYFWVLDSVCFSLFPSFSLCRSLPLSFPQLSPLLSLFLIISISQHPSLSLFVPFLHYLLLSLLTH